MADARLSDRELANINAAAVTKEYTVKPHLGMSAHVSYATSVWQYLIPLPRLSNRFCDQWVIVLHTLSSEFRLTP